MMNLDETIEYYRENAELLRKSPGDICQNSAKNQNQIAVWLQQLKTIKELTMSGLKNEPETQDNMDTSRVILEKIKDVLGGAYD